MRKPVPQALGMVSLIPALCSICPPCTACKEGSPSGRSARRRHEQDALVSALNYVLSDLNLLNIPSHQLSDQVMSKSHVKSCE